MHIFYAGIKDKTTTGFYTHTGSYEPGGIDMKQTLFDKMRNRIKRNKGKGDDNIGKKVGSSTLLVEEIGRGAMGAVYLGYDTKLDRQVAVKVLIKEMFKDERQFELLKKLLVQEGRNLAKVKHKGVVEVHELDDEFPALIMELIENGEDLHSFLYRKKDSWGTTGFRLWFLSIMEQIAFALGAAHAQGVVHKDLKFSNVMIFKDTEGEWRIKVIDFGLAQNLMRIKLSHGTVLLGTPSYMAPEQWDDHWSLDARADVYSLGVMLYEILMQNDFQESDDYEVIQGNSKDSMYVHRKVGHLPIDQRTPFKFMLAADKSKRAGGMLEVVGVLRNLRLAITDRDKEAPGTSFRPPSVAADTTSAEASSHKMAEEAEAEFEENLVTPPPVNVPIDPPKPPKRYDKTMMGHVSAQLGSIEVSLDEPPDLASGSEPESASADAGTSFEVSLSEFEDSSHDFSGIDSELRQKQEATRKALLYGSAVVTIIFLIVLPFLYTHYNGSSEKKSDPAPELNYKAPKPKVMKPAPVMKASMKPKAMKPAPMVKKPVKPVITKIIPPKPLPPKPPKAGEMPSLKYTVYLFNQEDKWCRENDPHRADFDKMPLWRAWCLRKRAVQMYKRAANNPEIAIAFLDEVKAHLCFWEITFRRKGRYRVKDIDLTKECGRIKKLIYKRFTYYLKGRRIHAIDKYLTGRRPHRAKLRAAWKKAHPDPK